MDKTKKQNASKKKVSKPDVKKAAPAKAAPTPPVTSGKRPTMEKQEKPSKKSALRDSILARKAPKKPIAFSLDEVRAIAKTVTAKAESTAKTAEVVTKPSSAAALALALEKPIKP